MLKIISREEAISLNLKFYFTGKPCVNGHLSERATKYRSCMECGRDNAKKQYWNDRELALATNKLWRENNKEYRKSYMQEYSQNHLKEHAEYMREWRRDNPEATKETAKKHRDANKEKINKDRKLKRDLKIAENPVAFYEKERKKSEKNKEKRKEYNKKWRENNREKRATTERNYRARKSNSEGGHTVFDVFELFIKQDGKCNGCCADIIGNKYHVDHIIPLSRGGSNWASNLQILCPTCNISKKNKMPDEWIPFNATPPAAQSVENS